MLDFSILAQPESWVALVTLTFLEIVLGVDNIIFISIVSNKLPEEEQGKARTTGLVIALVFRIGMLLGIKWIMGFTTVLFTIPLASWLPSTENIGISGRDLILLVGGLFLIAKSTKEIHHKVDEQGDDSNIVKKASKSLMSVIAQIILLDVIFSFDSILTAVGLTEHIVLMIIAVIISMFIMIIFAGRIASFIQKHPTLEVLALSFLILIGFMLLLESLHQHVAKGYIYFAVAFSLIVEVINIKMRKK